MTFEAFEERAHEEWERIPQRYREGVDGLVVRRSARPHPSLPDIYTLGECVTESYPSPVGDADTIRSLVVLYYGSFLRLSRLDPEFDWAGELWDTLTHELQHHLESLAADDTLGDMDYAADENYKRCRGEPFDPHFWRYGLPEGPWRRAEDEYFRGYEARAGDVISFDWDAARYEVTVPAEADADVAFLCVTGGVPEGAPPLHLVVLRPPEAWWRRLLAALRRAPPTVAELDVVARRAPE
jgi:hypothetical protein